MINQKFIQQDLSRKGRVRFAKQPIGLRGKLTKEEIQQDINFLKEKKKNAIAVKALLKRTFGASEFKALIKNAINMEMPYLRDHVLPFYYGESHYMKEINQVIEWCDNYLDSMEGLLKSGYYK